MHAPGHRWTAVMLVVAVTVTLGCRGSRSFGRFVEVTKGTETQLPEIPPPRQRLATTKARGEPGQAMMRPGTDDSPHQTRTASHSSGPIETKTQATRSDTGQTRLASDRSGSPPRAAQKPDNRPPKSRSVKTFAQRTSPTTATFGNEPETSDMDPNKLMAAFKDYPPEVQREALRRLMAATSRSADKTTQPKGLGDELAKNVENLPELPDPKNQAADVPPKRIATDQPRPTPTVASISDADQPKPSAPDKSAKGQVSDLVTTELESVVVQTISDAPSDDSHAVQPASASRGSDQSMIARAAVAPSSPKTNVKAATTKADSDPVSGQAQLSDQSLYAALLKRLSTAPEGESEAERNSRLIRLRHLMVLSGDLDNAVGSIEGMSANEQEFLRHQLLGLWTMIDPQGHPVPSRRFTTALPQIREAAKFAAAATDSLEVRSLAFCTEIESYGQIKTFPGNRFEAGQQVILYCEIENFTVNKTDDGFKTHLQGSYDVYNSDGEKVVSQLLPADQQVSANYLRDYFIAYQMHLPKQLQPGTYRLQLTMEDVEGKKYGQSSIPLEIAE